MAGTPIKGRDFGLQIESPAGSGTYINVGGLTNVTYTITNESVDATDKYSNGVRELAEGAGVQSHSITADFFPKNAASDDLIRTICHLNQQRSIKLLTGTSTDYAGAFDFSNYDNTGAFNGIEGASISLESAEGFEIAAVDAYELAYAAFVINV